MKIDVAERLLSDPKYVVQLCEAAIEELGKSLDLLDPNADPETLRQRILDRRGEVKGIRRVQGFFLEAIALVKNAREDEDARQQARKEFVAPPVAAGALLEPK